MTTRPIDTPDWASTPSGGSSVVEPPASKQAQGWLAFERPPSAFVNWAWNRFVIWVEHFASTNSVFTSMEGAINAPATAPFVIGDVCLIDEADGGAPGDVVVPDTFPTVATVIRVAACGAFIAGAADDGGGDLEIKIANRDGSGIIKTLTPTSVGVATTVKRFFTDGVDVIFAYTVTAGSVETVESINIATSTSNWVITPLTGGVITDIAWDQIHVYVTSTNVARQLVAHNRTTGAFVYLVSHGADLNSVATDGNKVYVTGAAGTGAFTLRARLAADGTAVWSVVQVAAPDTTPGTMATDSKALYVSEGANVIQRYSLADGGFFGVTLASGSSISNVVVDQDNVYIANSAFAVAFNKNNDAKIWMSPNTGFFDLAADGTAVFEAQTRLARGNFGPIRFKRVDPATATFVAMRQLLVPTNIA